MPIRKGAIRVHVFNSGLTVFLYDEANAVRLRASGAELLKHFSEAAVDDKALAGLAAKGLLVAYGLRQDDELEVEVVVGPPLGKKELEPLRWLEPQRTRLSMPSGMLCIESYDALRIEPEDPHEKGGRVKIPTGDYILTLYRVHEQQLAAEGIAYKGPEQVLVLTPVKDAEPLKEAKAYLPYVEKALFYPWVGKYKISKGIFEGLVVDCSGSILTLNFDEDAGKQLNLQYGQALRIQCGSQKFDAAFLGHEPHALFIENYGSDRLQGLTGAWWTPDNAGFKPPRKVLHIARRGERKVASGTRVKVVILPGPVFSPEPVVVEQAVTTGTEVVGTIRDIYLWHGFVPTLRTTIDRPALEAIGAKPGIKLALECGGVICPFELFADEMCRDAGIGKGSRLEDAKLNSKLNDLVMDYSMLLMEERAKPSTGLAKKKAELWKKIDKLRHTGVSVLPTCGCIVADVQEPKRLTLEVQPLRAVWIKEMHPGFDFTPQPGAEIRIRKNSE